MPDEPSRRPPPHGAAPPLGAAGAAGAGNAAGPSLLLLGLDRMLCGMAREAEEHVVQRRPAQVDVVHADALSREQAHGLGDHPAARAHGRADHPVLSAGRLV